MDGAKTCTYKEQLLQDLFLSFPMVPANVIHTVIHQNGCDKTKCEEALMKESKQYKDAFGEFVSATFPEDYHYHNQQTDRGNHGNQWHAVSRQQSHPASTGQRHHGSAGMSHSTSQPTFTAKHQVFVPSRSTSSPEKAGAYVGSPVAGRDMYTHNMPGSPMNYAGNHPISNPPAQNQYGYSEVKATIGQYNPYQYPKQMVNSEKSPSVQENHIQSIPAAAPYVITGPGFASHQVLQAPQLQQNARSNDTYVSHASFHMGPKIQESFSHQDYSNFGSKATPQHPHPSPVGSSAGFQVSQYHPSKSELHSSLAGGSHMDQQRRPQATTQNFVHEEPSHAGQEAGPSVQGQTTVLADDRAYTEALLLHQRARMEKLVRDLRESQTVLNALRQEVSQLESRQNQRVRSQSYPLLAEHLQTMRDSNRKLQIDVQMLAREIDIYNNGQMPLGVLNQNGAGNQHFYENIFIGQQMPLPENSGKPAGSGITANNKKIPPARPPPPTHPPPPPPPSRQPAPEPEEESNWGCSACTFLNHPALDKCECCEMPRIPSSQSLR